MEAKKKELHRKFQNERKRMKRQQHRLQREIELREEETQLYKDALDNSCLTMQSAAELPPTIRNVNQELKRKANRVARLERQLEEASAVEKGAARDGRDEWLTTLFPQSRHKRRRPNKTERLDA